MATTAAVTRDFRVHGTTDAGNDTILLNFTDSESLSPTTIPPSVYGPTASSSVSIVVPRTEAAGIMPGDIYTVTFTKKA